MIYKLCKKVIISGNYEKEDMQKKLDVYLLCDRITQEQYEELVNMITGNNTEVVEENIKN